MARPKKEGMDYFPHDTDAVNDEKIEALRSIYGNDGYAFYFILLERIYRTEKAELDVSKPILIASLAAKVGVTKERFNQMLKDACDLGLFDSDELENNQVITSIGVKKRFSEVNKIRQRWRKSKENNEEKEVFHAENGEENCMDNNDETNIFHQENTEVTGESKVKESKVKEIKNKNIYSPEFEEFWSVYPRQIGKKEASTKWNARLKENGVTPELLILCAKNYAFEVNKLGTEEKYIKHPATFLGPNKHYEDYKKITTSKRTPTYEVDTDLIEQAALARYL